MRSQSNRVLVGCLDTSSCYFHSSVFFPVLATFSTTASGVTFPFTVTFCSAKETSNDSTPVRPCATGKGTCYLLQGSPTIQPWRCSNHTKLIWTRPLTDAYYTGPAQEQENKHEYSTEEYEHIATSPISTNGHRIPNGMVYR
jgi:hypothetical protein